MCKCFNCKNVKKSKSKKYKYWCVKYKIKAQDEMNGCLEWEQVK